MSPFLSVIIPAYNEESRIKPTLECVYSYLSSQNFSWELIVVSDGSNDNTVEIVKNFCKNNQNIKIIDNLVNKGKGASVKDGMLAATGELRLFMDADSSTPIEELQRLLLEIKSPATLGENKYDVVIGSLGVNGAEIHKKEFFWRIIGGRMGNILIRFLFLPEIHDTQRGFKLFTKESAEKIFSMLSIDRWGFDIEALVLARKLNFKIKELPVKWSFNEQSKLQATAYFQVLFDVFRIWRGLKKKFPKTSDHLFAKFKDLFKQFPGPYYFLAHFFGGIPMNTSAEKFVARFGSDEVIVNIGSGPKILRKDVINVDVYPFKGVNIIAQAEKLPFNNQSVDVIVCDNLIEHVKEPDKVIQEICRILKPEGQIYVGVPFMIGFHSSPSDYYRWTHEGLRQFLGNYFVEIELNIQYGPTAGAMYIMYNWLAMLLSFNIQFLYEFWLIIFMILLAPIKLLDLLMSKYQFAKGISLGFYYIGKKK